VDDAVEGEVAQDADMGYQVGDEVEGEVGVVRADGPFFDIQEKGGPEQITEPSRFSMQALTRCNLYTIDKNDYLQLHKRIENGLCWSGR
jgi:hypothetical protein